MTPLLNGTITSTPQFKCPSFIRNHLTNPKNCQFSKYIYLYVLDPVSSFAIDENSDVTINISPPPPGFTLTKRDQVVLRTLYRRAKNILLETFGGQHPLTKQDMPLIQRVIKDLPGELIAYLGYHTSTDFRYSIVSSFLDLSRMGIPPHE